MMQEQPRWRSFGLWLVLSCAGLNTGCTAGDQPPQGARVDEEVSSAEYAVRLGSCLDSRGAEWEFGPRRESITVIETPMQPRAVQQQLIDGCRDELVAKGLVPAPRAITPALLEETFGNAAIVRECVQELGYPVPEMPDRRAFVEGDIHLPDLFGSVPEAALTRVFRVCGEAYR